MSYNTSHRFRYLVKSGSSVSIGLIPSLSDTTVINSYKSVRKYMFIFLVGSIASLGSYSSAMCPVPMKDVSNKSVSCSAAFDTYVPTGIENLNVLILVNLFKAGEIIVLNKKYYF